MNDDLFLIQHGGQLGLQTGGMTYALTNAIPSLDWLLQNVPAAEIAQRLREASAEPTMPATAALRAPIGQQEVWAAGVTYKRSEEARERESKNSTIYTRVYSAERPELFYKAAGPEVVASGQPVGIRYDATWSVPEPELVIVVNARMEAVGFTIGNDMSSRDIEGENPLYLPQAKVYERSCAVGPRLWINPRQTWPDATIQIEIKRAGAAVFSGETSTAQIHRTLSDLVGYLGRCRRFPNGAFLFTGTGLVPPDSFTLAAGDEVRIRIDPIGELVNTVMVVGPVQTN